MRILFADTFYWVALINRRDQWHARVVQITRLLGPVRIVTTQEVLVEVLTELSGQGAFLRRAAVHYVTRMRMQSNVEVLPQTPDSFAAGLKLYGRRLDKEYSMTDCISMAAMTERGLSEVLTGDHHFEQEGFVRLFHD